MVRKSYRALVILAFVYGDADSCELVIGPLEGHINTVTCVAVLLDDLIVSSSWDHTIRVWTVGMQKAVTNTLEEPPLDQSDIHFPARRSHQVVPQMMVPSADKSVQVMDDYGWVTQSDNALLWVPADYRQGFVEPAMIIPHCNFSINYDKFIHGPSWANIYR